MKQAIIVLFAGLLALACNPQAQQMAQQMDELKAQNDALKLKVASSEALIQQLDENGGASETAARDKTRDDITPPPERPVSEPPPLPPAQAIAALWEPPTVAAMPVLALYDLTIAGALVSQAGYIDGFPTSMACERHCLELENETGLPLAVFVDSRRATIFGGKSIVKTATRVQRDGRWVPADITTIPAERTAKFRMLEDGPHTITVVALTNAGGGVYMPARSRTWTWMFPVPNAPKNGRKQRVYYHALLDPVEGNQAF